MMLRHPQRVRVVLQQVSLEHARSVVAPVGELSFRADHGNAPLADRLVGRCWFVCHRHRFLSLDQPKQALAHPPYHSIKDEGSSFSKLSISAAAPMRCGQISDVGHATIDAGDQLRRARHTPPRHDELACTICGIADLPTDALLKAANTDRLYAVSVSRTTLRGRRGKTPASTSVPDKLHEG